MLCGAHISSLSALLFMWPICSALPHHTLHQATTSLEQALSHNFEVRDWAPYNLVKARVHCAQGDLKEALQTLEHAMKLAKEQEKKGLSINLQNYVSIFVELALVLARSKNIPQARKVVMEAFAKFRGTFEEGRITIAQVCCNLYVSAFLCISALLHSYP